MCVSRIPTHRFECVDVGRPAMLNVVNIYVIYIYVETDYMCLVNPECAITVRLVPSTFVHHDNKHRLVNITSCFEQSRDNNAQHIATD